MGLEKTLRRTDIPYTDYFEDAKEMFKLYPKKLEISFKDVEDKEVHDCGYTFAKYEVDRLIDFIAMAYWEIQYGELTDRLKGEIELDLPIWNSGEVDKFLTDKEKVLVYEHLNVIKEYINVPIAD